MSDKLYNSSLNESVHPALQKFGWGLVFASGGPLINSMQRLPLAARPWLPVLFGILGYTLCGFKLKAYHYMKNEVEKRNVLLFLMEGNNIDPTPQYIKKKLNLHGVYKEECPVYDREEYDDHQENEE
eukprot:TRINITY_DN39220_c0_g1_i1.p1 TRINITY_DN39220_c0_g1~~TRINITY_DN39220_c0_g1_i1.p1  ORF type:complete len:127 (+),score=16.58 TRINITY_DN39220_c0_g1_i1:229-609(+)